MLPVPFEKTFKPVLMADSCNSNTWEELQGLKASLGYIVSSRPALATEEDPISKNKKERWEG